MYSATFKSKKNFMNNLRVFTQELLSTTEVDWRQVPGFDQETFAKYFGVLINFCFMKRNLKEEADQRRVEETNNLLYKYSHRIFYEFISKPEIRIIIQIIFEKLGVDGVIANNSTLSTNPEEYKQRMTRLIKRIS